jgi:hypothetical protein
VQHARTRRQKQYYYNFSRKVDTFLFPAESGQHAGESFIGKIRGQGEKDANAVGQGMTAVGVIFFATVLIF